MTVRLTLVMVSMTLGCCTSPPQLRTLPSATRLDPGDRLLPIEWVDDIAFAAVLIDGKPAGRFMLDTGANAVGLTRAVVDFLKLRRVAIGDGAEGSVVSGANGTSAACKSSVPIAELRCGSLLVRDFDALEIDASQFQRALGCPIVGVLPVTVFRDVVLTIDYVARRVEVADPPSDVPRGPDTLLLRSASLPYVPLRVGGYEVDLLLDSGSDEFLTLPDQVAKPRRGRLVETGKARAIGGDVFTHQVRLDAKLDFAGHALVDPIVEVVQGREGTVGTALLRHFRIAIDQRHGCVTFSRACVEAVRSPPLRGMGIGLLRDGTHWTVAYLLEGTPGVAAGMQVGDEVVAIGGVAVGELSKGQYEQLLVEQDVLRLRVCAGSEVREVDVPVAVLVP